VRIIGGEFKGRKLLAVRGKDTRPTADRIREAIFNILSSKVREAVVLDLYAGTGALGLEALSRGAHKAIFIETDKRSLRVIKRNVEAIGLEEQATIIKWNILKNLDCLMAFAGRVNLVFMDPPYARNLIESTLSHLHSGDCLQTGARIIIEHSAKEVFCADQGPYHLEDQRAYGKTLVSFLGYML
jgi:16S rRNA (guanine966-N2)-methyltransferase